MATWAYPPLPAEQLEQEADSALERELEWLLRSLQNSLASLREGLHECAALLAPKEPGSTLVLSSLRSENVKGFVTRVGTKIVKGDIQLRLTSLASARGSPTTRLCLSNTPSAPELVLHQLVSVKNLVNQSLDVVDVSTWTGDPLNASFIYGQLRLLHETISEARQMLKGETDQVRGKWWEASAHDDVFDPPLPPYLSFHLSIADSALVLYLRTLESSTPTHTPTAFATDISLTGFNLRDRLFGTRHRGHDEVGDLFTWKGDEVRVREKIRVESQDPSLMAVMAKLTALQHEVMKWISALKVLMGNEDTDSEGCLDRNPPIGDSEFSMVCISWQRFLCLKRVAFISFHPDENSEGLRMLSIPPSSRASRTCSHGLLRTIASKSSPIGSQQLRGGATSFLAQRYRCTTAQTQSTLSSPVGFPRKTATGYRSNVLHNGRRHASTSSEGKEISEEQKDDIYRVIEKINDAEAEIIALTEDLNLSGARNEEVDLVEDQDVSEAVHPETAEARVRAARQQFKEYLPEGHLNDTELELYTQLYGEPIVRSQEVEVEAEPEEDERDPDRLYREDGQGGWQEVELEHVESDGEPPLLYDMEVGPVEEETEAMRRTREVAEQFGGDLMLEGVEGEADNNEPRVHPLTEQGKFAPNPSTVFLPKDTVTGPVSVILSDYSNKHLADTAGRLFGGRGLPYSTATPPPKAQLPQLPIPLEASQRHMTEMEANTFLATLYPGMYASVLSTLVEVRKRLGTNWLRDLIKKEDGPHILDASAGGAGVLAWREVIRAEKAPCPVGRSTVVTGSETLQFRASTMLENTTFLPRLPDYVHIREKPTLDDARAPPKRKQYDIIVAPHTLLGIEEEYMRKEYVENLWALLNPNGGVLILLEKGHQKGFEAIAGARDMLLKRHISSPGSTHYTNFTESPIEDADVEKEPGMIIAPCTNHEKCPMFDGPGHSKGRKDLCYFEQRYIRPSYLQRILGAKDRNHEDLKFSYVAVQRGVDMREKKNILQGTEATNAAFTGYGHELDEQDTQSLRSWWESDQQAQKSPFESYLPNHDNFHTLSLPRVMYPPMKRRGHVLFDLCTPEGKIERWTVPRSYSRQAYKDARKSSWGDLWALGAKTRIPRNLKIGDKHGEGKKERLARRAAERAEMAEEGELEQQTEASSEWPDLPIPRRQKGQTIPSWKKHADKKKLRQATKKHTAAKVAQDDSLI
ncbi:Rogdi leucine zipper containing protein-domain-containing protein [Aspergillus avenaceus]|uniref:Rogdi leucine zipper containing protein-domain-containing protein n=1 Tax=Aspergillus avenaceus TaxID=36643 RepID=A0A5N6TMF7_ASPAV|nr:Rogdi leucine zipper containing protein-domain-containing protein [Aspergillus avenaceus]